MRIAYLINQYPKTSHTFIRREIQALERAGAEVVRISIRGWNEPLVDDDDRAERQKTRYVLRSGVLQLLFSPFIVGLSRPILVIKAFILVLKLGRHSERPLPFHLVYLAEACLIVRWLQLESVSHLHAHFGTNSAEVAMLVHELGGPSWSFTVHGPEEFDKHQFIGLPDKIRRSGFVVAISSYCRSQLFRLVEARYWQKIQLIRCGLDSSSFRPQERKATARPVFICVGRLCEQKGQLLLLQAARRLRSLGIDFELVLAGDGEMRLELERFILREELGSSVRITGWISQGQVRHELSRALALVLPSFAEGLPVVIMEAMALGTPIISTYVAGIPELVHNLEHGWLVPAGDVEALVAAMRNCMECPADKIAAIGSAARDQVLRFHNIDCESNKLLQLFECSIETPS